MIYLGGIAREKPLQSETNRNQRLESGKINKDIEKAVYSDAGKFNVLG